jgi:predicted dehydrogenase
VTDRPDRLRVGIIGTGFAADNHADALRRLPAVELTGVASRTRERAVDAARRLGAERAYADPAELIDDPRIDAVHICTINRQHAELSAVALKANKHVVTEKPLATDSHSAEMLVKLANTAADSGTLSAVCFNYRHYPLVQQLRAMLASGKYGDVHFIHGSYLQDWLLYDTDWNWRVDPDDNGASRAVADLGSHWLDLIEHVSGQRISEVFADLATHHPVRRRPLVESATFGASAEGEHEPIPVHNEDFGTVMIRFAGGARGTFAVSQVSAGRKNRLVFEVDTSDAAFGWNQEQPDTAWVGRRSAANLECVRDPGEAMPPVQLPLGHPVGWRDALCNLFADFYGDVHARQNGGAHKAAFATFADGHRTTLLVDGILESHRTGTWVQIPNLEPVRA